MKPPATNQTANEITAAKADGLQRDFVTPNEFVQISGLSLSSVRRYLADGRLPKVQPGGRRGKVLIPRDALEQPSQSRTTRTNEPIKPESTPVDDQAPRNLSGPLPRWRRTSN